LRALSAADAAQIVPPNHQWSGRTQCRTGRHLPQHLHLRIIHVCNIEGRRCPALQSRRRARRSALLRDCHHQKPLTVALR